MKLKIDTSGILKIANRIVEVAKKAALVELQYLGEEMTAYVKDRPMSESWNDQTGNLRSSVGYSIYQNGKSLNTGGFDEVKNGSDGVSVGRDFAEKESNVSGFGLVLVAGMEYAENVERHEGKDVLASARIKASEKLQQVGEGIIRRTVRELDK